MQLLEGIIKELEPCSSSSFFLWQQNPSFLLGNYPAPYSPSMGFSPSPAPRWDMWPRPKLVTTLKSRGPVSSSHMGRRSKNSQLQDMVKNWPGFWDQSRPSIMPALNLGKSDTGTGGPASYHTDRIFLRMESTLKRSRQQLQRDKLNSGAHHLIPGTSHTWVPPELQIFQLK